MFDLIDLGRVLNLLIILGCVGSFLRDFVIKHEIYAVMNEFRIGISWIVVRIWWGFDAEMVF